MVISTLLEKIKDNEKITIIDYGAGKGRLLDGIVLECEDLLKRINYYAYDKFPEDSKICIEHMENRGFSKQQYFNNFESLKSSLQLKSKADIVFLVNVLHEIEPKYWVEIFNNIYDLLLPNGYLVLIEHSQLTIGEKPYNSGFVIVQDKAMDVLSLPKSKILCEHHKKNDTIAKYLIPQKNLKAITTKKVKKMLKIIRAEAIQHIKESKTSNENAFNLGIKLAFWTHQLANIDVIFANDEI